MPVIPYGHQDISEGDVDAVVAALRSGWLTQGPAVPRLEAALAGACGATHAVAVANGTAALHLACLAAGLGPAGLLWTSPITFVASANCGRYCGADVDFVDIDPMTYGMSVEALEKKLKAAERGGRLPDVVIPVHFAGLSCDMVGIGALAERYGFTVIEDACHALGGSYHGAPVGSCTYSKMAVFSFHPVKPITTGEGGAIVTNGAEIARRLRLLRTHGITKDAAVFERQPDGPWHYEQTELGYNYRLTDLQAALGASQMERLDAFLARREEIATRYDAGLAGLPFRVAPRTQAASSAWHLYVICVTGESPVGRAALYDSLQEVGIGVQVHYIPVHLQPYYRRLGFAPGDFPAAEHYYGGALSIPMYASLTDDQQTTVIDALRAALG
jgi:UDP-4-amino-4,6-dideoxy-N-acetyl-beta-L-altrosamine transaminase